MEFFNEIEINGEIYEIRDKYNNTYATKDEVKSYIDSVLAQKTQVQIIIWEDTD